MNYSFYFIFARFELDLFTIFLLQIVSGQIAHSLTPEENWMESNG
jgi:hypothetical protein